MRQRVMIGMALACDPSLLIADEPSTALDVTVQAQILELIIRLQAELGMAVIMITHDLGVIAEVATRVAVMYASKVVEYRAGARDLSQPAPPVHHRPAEFDSASRRIERAPCDDRRHGAAADALSERMPLLHALLVSPTNSAGRKSRRSPNSRPGILRRAGTSIKWWRAARDRFAQRILKH